MFSLFGLFKKRFCYYCGVELSKKETSICSTCADIEVIHREIWGALEEECKKACEK